MLSPMEVAMNRPDLPQLASLPFITDGGLETTLVFHDGIDLPSFAAFPLLLTQEGRDVLSRYFEPYFEVAARHRVGFVLDTPTWRANPDWGERRCPPMKRKPTTFPRCERSWTLEPI